MMKHIRNDIVKRWETSEGRNKQELVLNCLINNMPIDNLPFIEKIDGYLDLRGLTFKEKTRLVKVNIKDIDFSYSDFNFPILDECVVENVIFRMCDCTEMLQYGCYFKECDFINSKFLNVGFGIDGGQYIDTVFEDSDLRGAMFFHPDFVRCSFQNCKLDGVDFSASHLIDVKFIGKLSDVWFRGESSRPDLQKKLREKGRGLNPMIVDFSEAELRLVTYSDNCDLANVVIPQDGNYYLINNFNKLIKHLELEVDKITEVNRNKFTHEFVEMYKYHVAKQDMAIVNLKDLISSAEYYFEEESKSFCKEFLDQICKFSYS